MPSQISLRTSPVLSNKAANNVQVGHKTVASVEDGADGADMKAAARTVGSFLVSHKPIRKPHNMVNLNGSCGNSGTPKCFSMALHNGNGTVNMNLEANHCSLEHMNGTLDRSPSAEIYTCANMQTSTDIRISMATDIPPREISHSSDICLCPSTATLCTTPKTEAQQSNYQSSLTDVSNKGRLMCPELAISYTGTLISKRAGCLVNKQRDLEQRLTSLQRRIRLRQLHVVHSYACRQLEFDGNINEQESYEQESLEGGSECSLPDSDFSMELSPPRTGFLELSPPRTRFLELSPPRTGFLEISPPRTGVLNLPIQVDGASDDAFLPTLELEGEESDTGRPGRKRNEDSFGSMDSSVSSLCPSELEGDGGADGLIAQLASLETLLDGDLTEASSDEEGEEPVHVYYKHDLRCFWDNARSAVGSRWVWLQRRVAELNKQIYRLDHHVKESCSQEKFMFSSTTAASLLPQYVPLANGPMLEHFRANNGGGAGGLIAMKPSVGTNGLSHPPPYLPHLLLPEGLLNAKLQVKDLLSPSHFDRNLLFLDEANCSAARTRPLVRRANRKVIRKRGMRGGRNSSQPADTAFHPHLSMAHELPSRIPLDCALSNILSEHSYAQLPPLSKRRKAAASLTRLSTPLTQDYQRNHSASPSPVHTPQSLDSSRDGSARKKQAASLLHCQTSMDSSGGSPWSPGASRPSTPSFTPLQSARRKRATPLFDIDNIVIPYSVASSTRLEKLEYKEILTPNWREVGWTGPTCDDKDHPDRDVEDCSNEAYSNRHGRCELQEKKRFLNFISGGQRKRGRPQSMTLDCPALTSPPPPRRLTIASPSPTYAETELATRIRTVVLPWRPRVFPLDEAEEQALATPPPPPPILTRPTSPLHFCTSTPSKTPSCTSSGLATPVGSPHSNSHEAATPAMSPVEWIVNSQFPHAEASTLYNHRTIGTAEAAALLPVSPISHNPIILKLTKKV